MNFLISAKVYIRSGSGGGGRSSFAARNSSNMAVGWRDGGGGGSVWSSCGRPEPLMTSATTAFLFAAKKRTGRYGPASRTRQDGDACFVAACTCRHRDPRNEDEETC